MEKTIYRGVGGRDVPQSLVDRIYKEVELAVTIGDGAYFRVLTMGARGWRHPAACEQAVRVRRGSGGVTLCGAGVGGGCSVCHLKRV